MKPSLSARSSALCRSRSMFIYTGRWHVFTRKRTVLSWVHDVKLSRRIQSKFCWYYSTSNNFPSNGKDTAWMQALWTLLNEIEPMDSSETTAEQLEAQNDMKTNQLRRIADEWKTTLGKYNRHRGVMPSLGYQLSHTYTPKSLDRSTLTGRDAAIFRVLTHAKTETNAPLFTVHLAMLERSIDRDISSHTLQPNDAAYIVKLMDNSGDSLLMERVGWEMHKRPDGWLVYTDSHIPLMEKSERTDRDSRSRGDEAERAPIRCTGNRSSSSTMVWYYAAVVISPV